jgi:RimJ/RimL family protein N-acetyltransferase
VVTLRRATVEDVDWLVALYTDDDVEPFLGGQRSRGRAEVLTDVERSQSEPERFGRMIAELDGERAGAFGYRELSEVHRIVHLEALAVAPAFRRRGVADAGARLLMGYLFDELGFHRLELACYGFNDAAIRHSERVGFVREGVKRRAYMRHGEWQDAVQFALLADERDT